jgi:hypothetical protein
MGNSDGAILTFQRGWQASEKLEASGVSQAEVIKESSFGNLACEKFDAARLPFCREDGLTGRWLVVYQVGGKEKAA